MERGSWRENSPKDHISDDCCLSKTTSGHMLKVYLYLRFRTRASIEKAAAHNNNNSSNNNNNTVFSILQNQKFQYLLINPVISSLSKMLRKIQYRSIHIPRRGCFS